MKKHQILFFAIFLFAFILKTITLLNWHGLTFDEMVSADFAQKSLSEVIYYSQWETHPPFYYLVLNLWGHVFGQFESAWRALSLMISLASLLGAYLLAKELFGKKAGLIAMFLFSISVFFNFYGLWIRMYGIAILLSIFSFYFFIKILNAKDNTNLWMFLYLLATITGLYAHLFSLLAIFAQALFVAILFLKKTVIRQKIIRLSICLGTAFIFFLPWLILGLAPKLATLNSGAWYFSDHTDELLGLYAIITRLFFLTENKIIANIGLTIFLMVFSSAMIIIIKEKDGLKVKLDGSSNLLYALLIFAASLFSIAMIGMFRLRFFWLTAIGLIIIVSFGLSKIKNYRILAASLLVIFCLSAPGLYLLAKNTSSGWPEVGAFIAGNEKNGDIIIAAHPNHLLPLKFYYHKDLPQFMIGDGEPYEADLTRAILENNIYTGLSGDGLEALRSITANKKRIFLVYSNGGFKTDQDKVKNWLAENKWQTANRYESNSLDKPGILLLTR